MNTQDFNRAKFSLLRELDVRFQRYYHERLSDVINDLRLHHVDIKPDPSADELISIISRNKILNFTTAAPMLELRETFDRLKHGTFGICVDCGKSISPETLEKWPTTKLCDHCSGQKLVGFNSSMGKA